MNLMKIILCFFLFISSAFADHPENQQPRPQEKPVGRDGFRTPSIFNYLNDDAESAFKAYLRVKKDFPFIVQTAALNNFDMFGFAGDRQVSFIKGVYHYVEESSDSGDFISSFLERNLLQEEHFEGEVPLPKIYGDVINGQQILESDLIEAHLDLTSFPNDSSDYNISRLKALHGKLFPESDVDLDKVTDRVLNLGKIEDKRKLADYQDSVEELVKLNLLTENYLSGTPT